METAEKMSKAKVSKRGETESIVRAPSLTAPAAGPVSWQDYLAAYRKAAKGNDEAMGLVRRPFDEKSIRWRYLGNMESHARQAIAEGASGKDNLPQIEAALRMIAAKEAEISRPDASPLEKLLAARVSICWFEMSHLDAIVAANTKVDVSWKQLALLDERRDRADRRFRHAIKDLATVRRLLRPAPAGQVNAGMAQVNVGGPRQSAPSAPCPTETAAFGEP